MMRGHLSPFGEHGGIELVLHRGEREGESQFVPENGYPSKHGTTIRKEGHAVLAVWWESSPPLIPSPCEPINAKAYGRIMYILYI
jgi:hypothetical protein